MPVKGVVATPSFIDYYYFCVCSVCLFIVSLCRKTEEEDMGGGGRGGGGGGGGGGWKREKIKENEKKCSTCVDNEGS